MKKTSFIKCVLLILLAAGCHSQQYAVIYPVAPGVFQYYLPPTEWETEDIEVYVDITYRHIPGNSALCNISLVNSAKMPRRVSAAFFTGDGVEYPLENITKLFAEPQNGKLRITTELLGENLVKLFAGSSLSLVLVLDGTRHVSTPPDIFLSYSKQVLDDINS